MKRSNENIFLILLGLILFLQLVFLWIAYNKGGNITFGNILSVLSLTLTVLGWFMIYYLGFRQSKKTISIEKKIEIYEKLVEIEYRLFNKHLIDLDVTVNFSVIDYNNQKKIGDHFLNLSKKIFKTQKCFQEFVSCAYAWLFLMPGLEKARYLLEKEFNDFIKELRSYCNLLQKRQLALIEAKAPNLIPVQNRTKLPSEQEISRKKENIFIWSTDISNFIDDFLELVSDQLIYPTFNHRQRRAIENLKEGQIYRKLTKHGIIKSRYKLTPLQKELQNEINSS